MALLLLLLRTCLSLLFTLLRSSSQLCTAVANTHQIILKSMLVCGILW